MYKPYLFLHSMPILLAAIFFSPLAISGSEETDKYVYKAGNGKVYIPPPIDFCEVNNDSVGAKRWLKAVKTSIKYVRKCAIRRY